MHSMLLLGGLGACHVFPHINLQEYAADVFFDLVGYHNLLYKIKISHVWQSAVMHVKLNHVQSTYDNNKLF